MFFEDLIFSEIFDPTLAKKLLKMLGTSFGLLTISPLCLREEGVVLFLFLKETRDLIPFQVLAEPVLLRAKYFDNILFLLFQSQF